LAAGLRPSRKKKISAGEAKAFPPCRKQRFGKLDLLVDKRGQGSHKALEVVQRFDLASAVIPTLCAGVRFLLPVHAIQKYFNRFGLQTADQLFALLDASGNVQEVIDIHEGLSSFAAAQTVIFDKGIELGQEIWIGQKI
jgi:hypothetical protein